MKSLQSQVSNLVSERNKLKKQLTKRDTRISELETQLANVRKINANIGCAADLHQMNYEVTIAELEAEVRLLTSCANSNRITRLQLKSANSDIETLRTELSKFEGAVEVEGYTTAGIAESLWIDDYDSRGICVGKVLGVWDDNSNGSDYPVKVYIILSALEESGAS